jgi:hypothetical protein
MLCTNGSGRFKCTWVVSKLRARRDGGVEARDFKGGVAGRGAIALHVDKPGRRGALRHTKRLLKGRAQHACNM